MKKMIAGNWKMNGSLDEVVALMTALGDGLKASPELIDRADFVVSPSYIHLALAQSMLPEGVHLGAQDCSMRPNGAFTGDISAKMLEDMACQYVILGHSERRQHHGHGADRRSEEINQRAEPDQGIKAKLKRRLAQRDLRRLRDLHRRHRQHIQRGEDGVTRRDEAQQIQKAAARLGIAYRREGG